MITIIYYYWNKAESKMKKAEKTFHNPYIAIRFCWAMKNKKMFISQIICDDAKDNEIISQKVNIAVINMH